MAPFKKGFRVRRELDAGREEVASVSAGAMRGKRGCECRVSQTLKRHLRPGGSGEGEGTVSFSHTLRRCYTHTRAVACEPTVCSTVPAIVSP
eukprot:857865-Pyramimonas_sp.AAC.2